MINCYDRLGSRPADRAQGVFDDVLQQFAIYRIPKMESCSAILRGQWRGCNIQLELSPIPITHAVSVREARGD
jgi:hypothetical protein